MTCEDIPTLSQLSSMPAVVQAALDTYNAAVDESLKCGDRYEAIRPEARTNELIQDWAAAVRVADKAWTAYTRLYNRWIEYPADFEPAQESIELRNL